MIASQATQEASAAVPLSMPVVLCFLLFAFVGIAVAMWRGRREDRDARFARAHRISR